MPEPLRFRVFELDPSARELRKHGVRIKLQDQPFAVLLVLLEKPGQLVTKEELQQRLWPADTFVEFDKGIYNAIKPLREPLGDQAETPRYIETIPKRGYRFVGKVDASIFQTQSTAKARFGNVPAKTWWALAGVILLVLLCGLGSWRYTRARSAGAMRPMEVVPLVGLDGAQSRPAFSPDGNQIAFVLSNTNSPGIYTTLVSGGKPLRLTSGSKEHYPRRGPDGRSIAFTRPTEEGVAIYALPALGG